MTREESLSTSRRGVSIYRAGDVRVPRLCTVPDLDEEGMMSLLLLVFCSHGVFLCMSRSLDGRRNNSRAFLLRSQDGAEPSFSISASGVPQYEFDMKQLLRGKYGKRSVMAKRRGRAEEAWRDSRRD